jgi:hypothetical protein
MWLYFNNKLNMQNGFTTDTFFFKPTVPALYNTQTVYLGRFTTSNAPAILQLEIYFHSNGVSQSTASVATNLVSPSKMTVMLQILQADVTAGLNVTGYAVQYGNFLDEDNLCAVQYDGFYGFDIYIKMRGFGNPVVHATTTSVGTWESKMEVSSWNNFGSTYAPGTTGVTEYKIPIQYKFKEGMIETPNGFNISSSKRYKTNITDLPENYNLDMVMKMKPVIYNKKDEPGNEQVYPGLIAEELHDLSANLFVSYNHDNIPESLDYSRINVLLIKAAQQLNEKINKLTEDLKSFGDESII